MTNCSRCHKCRNEMRIKLQSGSSIVKVRPLFTSDSKYIIVASGTSIKVFSIVSGECTQTLQKHKAEVVGLQLNKSNHLQIFSCSVDGIVIRWDFAEGQALQVYNSKLFPVASFYAPSASERCFMITKSNTDFFRLYSIDLNDLHNVLLVLKDIPPQENAVAFGVECKFVATIVDYTLQIYQFDNKAYRKHFSGWTVKLCCVACHPTEFVVATGDDLGRVIIWGNVFLSNQPTKSIYHWHSLPLADLVFSSEGTYLYSGGGEASLVKWHVNSTNRHITPRMGLPIHRLAVSPNNDYVVTAHEDNALHILNSVNKTVQIIQGLTQGHFRSDDNKITLSTGILYDSRTESLVMNGKPGHLQFYKIHEDKQLFNLDIVGRNIMCKETDKIVVNTDVQKAALDDRGEWLATVEYWCADEISPEIHLKFWIFDAAKQTFVLNTDVFLPHNKEVNYVGFRPPYEDVDDLPIAVTTSNDGKFKIWSLKYENSSDKKESWICESMGYYRDLPAGDACFSTDGSLLAVAFGPIATLWIPSSMVLKARFCLPTSDNNIKQLIFGSGSCSHLLVCNSGSMIIVWNVLTLSAQLTINCAVQLLVPNRKSDIIAAFCVNQDLFVFKPSNPTALWFIKKSSDTPVLAAIFVPRVNISEENQSQLNCWHKMFQLFFFNEDQNLLTITDELDIDSTYNGPMFKIEQNIPATAFGMLQAERTTTGVKTDFTKQHVISTETDNSKMFSVSCPTNQNPIALCSVILPSLLIPAKKKENEEDDLINEGPINIDSDEGPMDVDENCKTAKDSIFPTDFVGITDFSFLRETVSFTQR